MFVDDGIWNKVEAINLLDHLSADFEDRGNDLNDGVELIKPAIQKLRINLLQFQ